MEDKLMKKMIILAMTLLDKQDGMCLLEWNLLRAMLEESKTFEGREIIDNVTDIGGHVFIDEKWVEENYHRFE